jgi:hypothetical protein
VCSIRLIGVTVHFSSVSMATGGTAAVDLLLTPRCFPPGSRPHWLGHRGSSPTPPPRLAPVAARLGSLPTALPPVRSTEGRNASSKQVDTLRLGLPCQWPFAAWLPALLPPFPLPPRLPSASGPAVMRPLHHHGAPAAPTAVRSEHAKPGRRRDRLAL